MVNVVLFDTKYFLMILGYCLVLPWVKTSLESISSTCKKKKKQNLTFVNFLLLPKFLPALQGSKSNAWVLVCTCAHILSYVRVYTHRMSQFCIVQAGMAKTYHIGHPNCYTIALFEIF